MIEMWTQEALRAEFEYRTAAAKNLGSRSAGRRKLLGRSQRRRSQASGETNRTDRQDGRDHAA